MTTRTDLNFSVVSNNDVSLNISVLDENGDPVDASALSLSIKWTWFITGMPVTKSTLANTLSIVTSNPLVIGIPILATDTIGAKEGSYPHEAVTVDINGNAVTITGDDSRLAAGVGFVRKQLTVQ
jgi:hypothetical protein